MFCDVGCVVILQLVDRVVDGVPLFCLEAAVDGVRDDVSVCSDRREKFVLYLYGSWYALHGTCTRTIEVGLHSRNSTYTYVILLVHTYRVHIE